MTPPFKHPLSPQIIEDWASRALELWPTKDRLEMGWGSEVVYQNFPPRTM